MFNSLSLSSFNCLPVLSSMFFSLFNNPSCFSPIVNPFNNSPKGLYSNFAFCTGCGLYPRSLPVKYSYLFSSPLLQAEISAFFLFKSKSACCLESRFVLLIVIFYKDSLKFLIIFYQQVL